MKKFFVALFMLLSVPAFATGLDSTASTADCNNATLNTYTGTSNLSAGWQPNTIALHWYNGDTEITVPTASQSCTYDDTLTPPATIPTKTGYTFKGWKVRGLPAGYTRLQYIQSTGTQYIDTGISGPARWVGSAQASSNTTRSQVMLIGNYAGYKGTFVGSVASNNEWTTWDTSDTDYPITSAQVFDLTWTNTGVSGAIGEVRNINHDLISGQGLSGTWKICSSMYPFAGKLYYFKAYQNDIIVRDFVPAKNSSGVIGMYDTVSKTFFTNAGTGSFIAGPVAQ